MPSMLPEALATVSVRVVDAARITGISENVIREHVRRGDLVMRYPTTHGVLLTADLEEWIATLPTAPPGR